MLKTIEFRNVLADDGLYGSYILQKCLIMILKFELRQEGIGKARHNSLDFSQFFFYLSVNSALSSWMDPLKV